MPPKRKETGENSSSASSSKRQQQSSRDIISSLPDTILHHILSFLDMKHAVQTSILSKRWTDLWASLGCLTFNSELFYLPRKKRCDVFVKFVDQVLLLRDNSSTNIQKFHLINSFNSSEIKIRLNTWILSAIRNKVRQLKIELWEADGIRLPNRLFACNSLTIMLLALGGNSTRWSITLPPDSSMCLPNLVTLELCTISFHDENLTNKFFLSCPNLKQLLLDDVEFLHMNVNISALKLVYLKVNNHSQEDYGYCHWPNTKFKLHAPDLKHFICKDYMSKHYILGNLPSLLKADIDMKIEEVEDQNLGLHSMIPARKKQMYAQRMMQCLKALLSVKDLKLSAWFLEVISGSFGCLESQPNQLCDLRCLRLETWLSWNTIQSITYLLNISPNLKSIFLKISKKKFGSENIGNYVPEAEASLQCLLDKLGCVEIRGAVGCVNELKFLEILLKNAKVLKKLVVYTTKVTCLFPSILIAELKVGICSPPLKHWSHLITLEPLDPIKRHVQLLQHLPTDKSQLIQGNGEEYIGKLKLQLQ